MKRKIGSVQRWSDGHHHYYHSAGASAAHGDDPNVLLEIKNKFFSYILSFVYLAIYWNNHHHLTQVIQKVNGKIL